MIAYKILGIEVCDCDKRVRAAYLEKTKEYPPEKFPEQFMTLRKAYELIETKQKRVEYFLFGKDDEFDLEGYEKLLYPLDKKISQEKWNQLCEIYQKRR